MKARAVGGEIVIGKDEINDHGRVRVVQFALIASTRDRAPWHKVVPVIGCCQVTV